MNENETPDVVLEEVSPLVATFRKTLDYVANILAMYTSSYGASIRSDQDLPGDEWKTGSAGESAARPVELGALLALGDHLTELGFSVLNDYETAAAELREVCLLLLPIARERRESVTDPVASYALGKAILYMANFLRATRPQEETKEIRIRSPRFNARIARVGSHLLN